MTCVCFNPMHWEFDIDYVATDRKNIRGQRKRLTDQKLISSKEGNKLRNDMFVEQPLSTSPPCRQMAWQGSRVSACMVHPPVIQPADAQAIWLIHTKEQHSKSSLKVGASLRVWIHCQLSQIEQEDKPSSCESIHLASFI